MGEKKEEKRFLDDDENQAPDVQGNTLTIHISRPIFRFTQSITTLLPKLIFVTSSLPGHQFTLNQYNFVLYNCLTFHYCSELVVDSALTRFLFIYFGMVLYNYHVQFSSIHRTGSKLSNILKLILR